MELVPLFANGKTDGRCNGFALEIQLPNGQSRRQTFSISSLGPVADRAADALMTAGVLAASQQFFYEIIPDSPTPISPPPEPLPR